MTVEPILMALYFPQHVNCFSEERSYEMQFLQKHYIVYKITHRHVAPLTFLTIAGMDAQQV